MRLVREISREEAKENKWFLGTYIILEWVTDDDAAVLELCGATHFAGYDEDDYHETWRIGG